MNSTSLPEQREPVISLEVEVSETLYNNIQRYLEGRQGFDQSSLIEAAIAQFFMQTTNNVAGI
jgi:hypothetical protein